MNGYTIESLKILIKKFRVRTWKLGLPSVAWNKYLSATKLVESQLKTIFGKIRCPQLKISTVEREKWLKAVTTCDSQTELTKVFK